MVGEWEAAVTYFTEFTAHFHYSTSLGGGHPIEPLIMVNPGEQFSFQPLRLSTRSWTKSMPKIQHFHGAGIFHQITMNDAQRVVMSGTSIATFWMANGTIDHMDYQDYKMYMACYILSLERKKKLLFKATPPICAIEELHWILCIVACSSWLSRVLPAATFNYSFNIYDHWVADGSNVLGSERGAGSTPVEDPSMKGSEFRSSVRTIILTCCTYQLPEISIVGKLSRAT